MFLCIRTDYISIISVTLQFAVPSTIFTHFSPKWTLKGSA